MKIKSNKGYVGVDISIAIVILLFMIPTIMGMVYAINSSKLSTKIKSEATSILVNTIEAAKGINVENLEEPKNIFDAITGYNLSDIKDSTAVIKTDTASYKLQIDILDYGVVNAEAERKKVKTITATVFYKIRNNEENMNLRTVIK